MLQPGSPCTSSMHTNRVLSTAGAFAFPAGIIASRYGRATATPIPRTKVRRGMCLPAMNDIVSVSLKLDRLVSACGCLRGGRRRRFHAFHLERVALHYSQ